MEVEEITPKKEKKEINKDKKDVKDKKRKREDSEEGEENGHKNGKRQDKKDAEPYSLLCPCKSHRISTRFLSLAPPLPPSLPPFLPLPSVYSHVLLACMPSFRLTTFQIARLLTPPLPITVSLPHYVLLVRERNIKPTTQRRRPRLLSPLRRRRRRSARAKMSAWR